MFLFFNVEKQILSRKDSEKVVRDSVNYLHASFTFSEDWTGQKTAVFKSRSGAFNVLLDENESCVVPWEVLKDDYFDVSVFCGDLITANVVRVLTISSGYEIGEESRIPTPDIYNQIIEMINDIDPSQIDPEDVQQAVEDYLATKDLVSEVTVTQEVSTGTKIATIKVDDTTTEIFAPAGGGDGGASTINDLTDVEITDATNGDVLSFDGEKWVNVPAGEQPPAPTPEPVETTETITTYTAGKVLKFKDANHIPSEIMEADSAYTLGVTDYISMENVTNIVLSAFAVAGEWNLSYVYYDANRVPIYGGCPGNDGVAVDTTNKFVQNYTVPVNSSAAYIRFVFWSNALITWEHPYAKITYVEGAEPVGTIQTKRFHVAINKATIESGDYTAYSDYGILFLPATYKSTGAKTRLVIACHGSGTVIDDNFDIDTKDYIKTLVHMGYAVMDVNGGVADGRHYGAYFAVSSYIKAYHHVINNYNIYPDVFVFGASMGGLCSFALVQGSEIPVIAQAAICPVTDLLRQAWMSPWWNESGNYGKQRERIAEYYNFDNYASYTSGTAKTATSTDMQYFVDNYKKTMGYNPMVNCAINGLDVITTATSGYSALYADLVKFHDIPLLALHAEDDNYVAYEFTTYIVEAIKRGGGTVYFKSYATGGHSPNLGGAVTLTGVDGVTFSSYDSLSRIVNWFNRFN